MRATLVLAGLVIASAGDAGAQRAMTAEDVAGMRQLQSVRISPDGQWVAYTVSVPNLKESSHNSDVWLVAAAGGPPVRLTASPKADGSPQWSPDGRWIAFLSAREERPQIWRISPFGGEAERLTSSKSGVSAFAWSPDGRRLAYVAPRVETPEEEQRKKEKDDAQVVDSTFQFTRLWILDVDSLAAREVVSGDFQVGDPQWAPDGRSLAYVRLPTTKADDARWADIFVLDVSAGTSRKLVENLGPDTSPRWSPDGSVIAFLTKPAANAGVLQSRLAVVPSSGGAPRELAPGFLHQPGTPVWSPDGQSLLFWSQTGTRSALYRLPVAGGTPRLVSEPRGSVGFEPLGAGPSVSRDGRTTAFAWSDVQSPPDVHVTSLEVGWNPRRVSTVNPELAGLSFGRSEVLRWKSRDGLEIEGLVIYPVGYQPGTRYPTLVQVHGGPAGVWAESFPGGWNNYGHVYAGRGWVVFYPNPRGSSGYGDKFLMANYRDWGGGDYRDVQTGLDELIRRGIADPERLGQGGWSYGGYLTAWTLTQTARYKAVMVGAGLTNMYSMYSTNDLQTLLEEYFGAEPWDDEPAYWQRSAMAFIKKARTPTLILHGAVDTRVPLGQAQELYMGLRKNEVPVELVVFPREPHGLQEPRHQLDKMKRELAWFSRHVLGTVERALVP